MRVEPFHNWKYRKAKKYIILITAIIIISLNKIIYVINAPHIHMLYEQNAHTNALKQIDALALSSAKH